MYTKKNGRMTYKSNRRPNFKRYNNFSSKNRNKGNVTQQYNKYLKLAKDTFSAGDRIQAEYYYQFTDHYYRLMVELGINIDENSSNIDIKNFPSTPEVDKENNSEQETASDENLQTDLIIARAFKPLPIIFEIAFENFKKFKYIIMFLGKSGKQVLKEATKKWKFNYEEKKSLTNDDSLIIKISNLQKKNG